MIASIFDKGLEVIAKGEVDWESDLIVILLNNSHTTDTSAQEFIADVDINELSGGGYSRKALAPTVSIVDGRAEIGDLDETVWTSLTGSNIRHAVVAKDTGDDATSPLIFAIDFEQNYSPSSQDFTVFWRLALLARLVKG